MPERFTNKFIRDFAATGGKKTEMRDTEVPQLILRASPSGHKSFQMKLYTPDRAERYTHTLGPADAFTVPQKPPRTKRDRQRSIRHHALDLLNQSHHDDLREKRREAKRERQADTTLGDFLDHYPDVAKQKVRHPDQTVTRVRAAFASLLKIPLRRISVMTINGWIRKADKAPSTIKRDLMALSEVLAAAIREKIITDNLVSDDAIDRPVVPDDPHIRFLSKPEAKALRGALAKRDDHLPTLILLALNTGMRRGELLKLDWSEIDFETGMITVRARIAKTPRTRYIPLNVEAREVLTKWRARTGDQGLVFGGLASVKRAYGTLRREVSKTCPSFASFRFHDFRHDFASKLVMAGRDVNSIRELLGHREISTTLKYTHVDPESHLAQAVAALDR